MTEKFLMRYTPDIRQVDDYGISQFHVDLPYLEDTCKHAIRNGEEVYFFACEKSEPENPYTCEIRTSRGKFSVDVDRSTFFKLCLRLSMYREIKAVTFQ